MFETTPLPHKIHMLAHMIEQRASAILNEKGNIAFNSFVILHKLGSMGDLNQQFLAEKMQVSTAAISKRIKLLSEKNLVKVKTNPENRRENIITITSQGRKKLDQLTTILMNDFEDNIKDFKERKSFEKSLNKLLEIMCGDSNDRQTC